ncbi:MAG: GDSL-type esterase/lipase family protein, partial [Ginsengibacter sp.]
MKFILKLITLTTLFITTIFMSVQKKTKILFFGDSITQAGVGAQGFITKLNQTLKEKNLEAEYELTGAGIGGNKIYDLYLRMDSDVIAKNPDVVVIWVGVNDVWHKSSSGTGTDPDKFQRFYAAIIKKLQAKNIKLFLVTPAIIGEKTDNSNSQDGDLNQYSKFIRKLAADFSCGLIDFRKDFLEYNLRNNPENKESGILTTDRVHLNEKGNQFVAEKMFDN